MTKGRSIRMFLVDGTPGGIITAEIMNWTGHVLFGPRSRLPDLIQRDEAKRTGVYFLTGDDPEGGFKPLVYVGETDNVGKRLAQHDKDEKKDFWDRACVVTSKDQNLTKAHAKFIESSLISIIQGAERAKIQNNTTPDYSQLPEADKADMEFFIEQIRIVLPVLGMNFLKPQPSLDSASTISKAKNPLTLEGISNIDMSEIYVFEMETHGVKARATLNDGEFIVHAGSGANRNGTNSWKSYVQLHNDLLEQDILVETDNPDILEFAESYAFKSPSAAACVVAAATRNGRTSWKVIGSTKTYADWLEEQVAAVNLEGD